MGNGFHPRPAPPPAPPVEFPSFWISPPPRRKILVPVLLFILTVFSTLAVGAHLTAAFHAARAAFPADLSAFGVLAEAVDNPFSLLTGWPFALTLLTILGAHELGHFFAARHHGIHATYPYFIPFPNLIGTMGAFIRIQSPIADRRALFDVGVSGPIVGFVFAVPALALGLWQSHPLPGGIEPGAIVFGHPPLLWLGAKLFHPGVPLDQLSLSPMARAAWVGLFATALNLLPIGQLDGGHILYALSHRRHRLYSRLFLLLLAALGAVGFNRPDLVWPGWLMWGVLLLLLGMRHPIVLNPGRELDPTRVRVAWASLGIFLLCFTPLPFHVT